MKPLPVEHSKGLNIFLYNKQRMKPFAYRTQVGVKPFTCRTQ